MKTYLESTLSYQCTGCHSSIYNAIKKYDRCPECGYPLKKIGKKVKELYNESKLRRS